MKVKSDIDNSKVFEIIKKMPKGALLHVHVGAFVSADWVYNATYRENLYACNVTGNIAVRFFEKPPTDNCDWKLLSEHRNDSDKNFVNQLNKKIKESISIAVDDPDSWYSTPHFIWPNFTKTFRFVGPLLDYRPVFEAHIYEGLRQLYEDNVMYVELKTTKLSYYELNGTTCDSTEDVMKVYENVIEE